MSLGIPRKRDDVVKIYSFDWLIIFMGRLNKSKDVYLLPNSDTQQRSQGGDLGYMPP